MTGNEILRTMSHWVKSRARSLKIIWEGAVKGSEKDKCPTQEGAGRGQRTRHCTNLTPPSSLCQCLQLHWSQTPTEAPCGLGNRWRWSWLEGLPAEGQRRG